LAFPAAVVLYRISISRTAACDVAFGFMLAAAAILSFFPHMPEPLHRIDMFYLALGGAAALRVQSANKVAVAGLLERGSKAIGSKVYTKVVDNTKKKILQSKIREHVLAGSALFTDSLKSYEGMNEFQHEVVDHAVEYVRGEVHTNGMENFWSLVKRGLNGAYISVEPFHLFRYLDEQVFRYNNRKGMNDADRFVNVMRNTGGKRLTWKQLTGKTEQPSSSELM
jgi:transposase-like protein